jgi:hypothetical protein
MNMVISLETNGGRERGPVVKPSGGCLYGFEKANRKPLLTLLKSPLSKGGAVFIECGTAMWHEKLMLL